MARSTQSTIETFKKATSLCAFQNTIEQSLSNKQLQTVRHSPMSDVLAGEPIPLQPPFFRPSHAHPLWRHALFLFVAQLLLAAGSPIPLQPPFFRPSHRHPLWRHALFLFCAQLLLAAGSLIPLQPPLFRPSHRHPFWRHFFFLRLPQRPSRVDSPAATTVGSSQLPLHMQPDLSHVFRLLMRGHVRGSARLLQPASAPWRLRPKKRQPSDANAALHSFFCS